MENWELGAVCLTVAVAVVGFIRWAWNDIDQELEEFCEDIYREKRK